MITYTKRFRVTELKVVSIQVTIKEKRPDAYVNILLNKRLEEWKAENPQYFTPEALEADRKERQRREYKQVLKIEKAFKDAFGFDLLDARVK